MTGSEKAIPPGMKAYGLEHPDYPDAPKDWDHGPYLCRDGEMYHMRGYGWGHGIGCWNPTASWDRIMGPHRLHARQAQLTPINTMRRH